MACLRSWMGDFRLHHYSTEYNKYLLANEPTYQANNSQEKSSDWDEKQWTMPDPFLNLMKLYHLQLPLLFLPSSLLPGSGLTENRSRTLSLLGRQPTSRVFFADPYSLGGQESRIRRPERRSTEVRTPPPPPRPFSVSTEGLPSLVHLQTETNTVPQSRFPK